MRIGAVSGAEGEPRTPSSIIDSILVPDDDGTQPAGGGRETSCEEADVSAAGAERSLESRRGRPCDAAA